MNVMPMRFSIQDIMTHIASLFSSKKKIELHEAAPTGEKSEIIGTFMAALEMSKLSIIRLIQKGLFSTIYLVKRAERD
jgi:chromatin segregation and condensation protein Rec8/ScpA/Scc1 (kleisin family)